jgi:DNA repair protein RadC
MPDKKLSIKEWADDDKPREKMISKGVYALSDSELLAILISTGSGKESALDLAKNILKSIDHNLSYLSKSNIEQLTKLKGIGTAKATTILAAIELGRRISIASPQNKMVVKNHEDASALFDHIRNLDQEEFWLACLNRKSEVIDLSCIHKGAMHMVLVDARLIFARALEKKAHQIIVAHNHPSGDPKPSDQDRQLTENLKNICRLMNIHFADHIILAGKKIYSFNLFT